MSRFDRLRAYAESLRRPAPGETRAQRQERHALREEAERRLREHDRAMVKWDVQEDPAVLEFHRRRVGNHLADGEVRERLRREVPEPVEHPNPAAAALATSDAERSRAAAWGDDNPREGWIS